MRRTHVITATVVLAALAGGFVIGQEAEKKGLKWPWAPPAYSETEEMTRMDRECLERSWKAEDPVLLRRDWGRTGRKAAFVAMSIDLSPQDDHLQVDVQVKRLIKMDPRAHLVMMSQNARKHVLSIWRDAVRWPMRVRLTDDDGKVVFTREFNFPQEKGPQPGDRVQLP